MSRHERIKAMERLIAPRGLRGGAVDAVALAELLINLENRLESMRAEMRTEQPKPAPVERRSAEEWAEKAFKQMEMVIYPDYVEAFASIITEALASETAHLTAEVERLKALVARVRFDWSAS